MSATQEQVEWLGRLIPGYLLGDADVEALRALLREREELQDSHASQQRRRAIEAEAKLAEAQREIERLRSGWDDAARANGRLATDNVAALRRKDERVAELEAQLGAVHEALGESPDSDHESLGRVVAQFVSEHRERISWLEAQLRTAQEAAVSIAAEKYASEEARKRAEEKLARIRADVRRVCEDVAPPDAREDVLPTDMLVPHYKLKRLLLALLAEADQKGDE